MIMPKPTVRCSKCNGTNIVRPERVIPEWPANSPVAQPTGLKNGDVELRCKDCGHEKPHQHRDWEFGSTGGGIYTLKTEETF